MEIAETVEVRDSRRSRLRTVFIPRGDEIAELRTKYTNKMVKALKLYADADLKTPGFTVAVDSSLTTALLDKIVLTSIQTALLFVQSVSLRPGEEFVYSSLILLGAVFFQVFSVLEMDFSNIIGLCQPWPNC